MYKALQLSSGYNMPTIALGTAKAAPGTVANAVEHALMVGYRHIDCAYIYGNEGDVGQGLKTAVEKGIVKRDEVFITSKLWTTFYRKDLVRKCLQQSLDNLGVKYIDLYLLHWPFSMRQLTESELEAKSSSLRADLFPIDANGRGVADNIHYLEPWKVLEECVRDGLIRSIGLSNFNSVQIQEVLDNAEIKPSVLQIECHPYQTQVPLVNFCRERDLQVAAFCPLGGPLGNDGPFNTPIDRIHDNPILLEIGKKHGKTAAQVALRFNVQRGVAVLPRSCNKSRQQENFNILDFDLSEEDMEKIFSLNRDLRTVPALVVKDFPQYPFKIPF